MKLFLTYASGDARIAEEVLLDLLGRGHTVFFERKGLPAGNKFEEQIEQAIASSDILVPLISPESMHAAGYTATEVHFARKKWPSPDGRVLPVMVRPTPADEIPPYLREVTILEPEGAVPTAIAAALDDMAAALRPGRRLRGPILALTLLLLLLAGAGVAAWQAGLFDRWLAPPQAVPEAPVAAPSGADAGAPPSDPAP